MTSLRRASSSTPMASICSGERCASALGRPERFTAGRCGRGSVLVTDRRGLMPCGLVDAWLGATWCGSVGEIVRRSGARVMGGPSGSRGRAGVGLAGLAGLELEVTGAGDGVDAGLHGQLVAGLDDGDVTGAQVADGALAHG